jgi:hypothetical protein
VGGASHLDRPNFPVTPGYHPADVVARLAPFDQATLDHFIFLERPECEPLPDGPGFKHRGTKRECRQALTPTTIDYETIGELYDGLASAFTSLSSRMGETVLIDPKGRGQLDSEQAGLPNIRRVTSLEEALATIEQVKEQGEGSTGSREDSHFDRFLGIKREWEELKAAGAAFEPAWPAARDPVMRLPADGAERVWIRDPRAAAHLDVGNAAYGTMLVALTQIFGSRSSSQQHTLMGAATALMEVAAVIGNALARMPADSQRPGVNAGLTFTVPRNTGFRARFSPDHLRERVEELRACGHQLLEGRLREKVASAFQRSRAAMAGLSSEGYGT